MPPRKIRVRKFPPPLTKEPWDSDAELDLLRSYCLTDFWTFFCLGFGAMLNPRGARWIDDHMHRRLAAWFQFHVDEWFERRAEGRGEQKRLAAILPRECGKSTMLSEAGMAWMMLRDPELSIYYGSEKMDLSIKLLEAVKSVLDGSDPYSLFPKLFGAWSNGAKKWSAKEVVHGMRRNTSRKDPSFGTFAVETSIVGAHPDVWCHDDPISYERLTSDTTWLSTVNSQISSMEPVIQSDGFVLWPGTRYDDGDHFGVEFAQRGVKSLTGMKTDTIEVTEDGEWHVFFWSARDTANRTHESPDGVPTIAKIWSEKRLRAYQRVDPLRYASQVLNDPGVSEFNPLTRDQIKQCEVDPKDVPWHALRFAFMTDTAFADGTRMAEKDETVIVVHGYPRNGSGDVYVIEGYGDNRWRAEDFANRLVMLTQRYRKQGRNVFAITDEKTRAGKKGAWGAYLQNYFHDAGERMPRFIEFERGSTQKEMRLVTAASFWVDGHVRLVKGGPNVDRVAEQMAKIGQYMVNKRIKIDWADAHSDAFQPEVYTPMRRAETQNAPWEKDAKLFDVEGLDPDMFRDDLYNANPRPPIR